jgi:hypothetical protein
MQFIRSRAALSIVAFTVAATACGGATSSTDATGGSSTPTVATSAAPTESTSATDATPTSAAEASTTSQAVTTTTEAATTTVAETTTTTAAPVAANDAPAGSVIITAEDGVFFVSSSGSNQLIAYASEPEFASDRIDFAISDTRGGVIIHPDRAPFFYKGNNTIVYRIPLGGSSYQQMLVPAADQGLSLEDVVRQGPNVGVYYTRLEGSFPEDMVQTLRRYDLDSKDVQEITDVAGWESGAWNFSVGENLIVHQWAEEGYAGFQFRDVVDGMWGVWSGDPTDGGEFDCYPECHVAVAVSPGGHQVAWAQRQAGTFWVTVTDVEFGTVVASFTLPNGVYEIHSIDLGDDYLVVNRQEEGNEWFIEPLLVNLVSLGVTEIPMNGLARLTLVVPTLDGVVQYP